MNVEKYHLKSLSVENFPSTIIMQRGNSKTSALYFQALISKYIQNLLISIF